MPANDGGQAYVCESRGGPSRLVRVLSINYYLPGSHQLPPAVAREFENCIVVAKRLVAVAHSEIGNRVFGKHFEAQVDLSGTEGSAYPVQEGELGSREEKTGDGQELLFAK